jgi:hypothetical protein
MKGNLQYPCNEEKHIFNRQKSSAIPLMQQGIYCSNCFFQPVFKTSGNGDKRQFTAKQLIPEPVVHFHPAMWAVTYAIGLPGQINLC